MLKARIPLVDPRDCKALVDQIYRLRPQWQSYEGVPNLYRLGTAAYIEGHLGPDAYLEAARSTNVMLGNCFEGLYSDVFTALSDTLGNPVVPANGFALPGFHIFATQTATAIPVAERHKDFQYQLLPWPVSVPADVALMSFTLPLAIPMLGTGLRLWHDDDPASASDYQPYSLGEMVVHDGLLWHQAAAPDHVTAAVAGDQRITLQGHGLHLDGRWQVYF